jgi:hypothetical protein
MEPEGSLLSSQEPANCPYPEMQEPKLFNLGGGGAEKTNNSEICQQTVFCLCKTCVH